MDDAEGILKFYKELFGQHGFDVVAASNGHQALDAFHSRAPNIDAVILDYEMPGMTGLELAILLKQKDPTLPIMMISGIASEWDEMSPFIDAALAKGVPVREIVRELQLLIAQRSNRPLQTPC